MIEVVVCEMRRQDDDNTISHYITYCTGYTSLLVVPDETEAKVEDYQSLPLST